MDKVIEKMQNGHEYRDAASINIAESETPDYRVEGYASTYNQPYELAKWDEEDRTVHFLEQVDSHAFDDADMSDVIMQYDHKGRVYARTKNNSLQINKDDEHGLYIVADLGGTELGRQLYEEIKGGYTSKMSFGFTVTDDEVREQDRQGKDIYYLRTIKSIGKLYDVSAVSLPANDYTEISARSYVDGAIARLEAERLQAQKKAELKASLEFRIKSLKGE